MSGTPILPAPQELARLMARLGPAERGALLTQAAIGLDGWLGFQYTWLDPDRVEVRLPVEARHTQVYGLVHGGLYCALAETSCSVGVGLRVLAEGHNAVGVENRTRFRKAARVGAVLIATAEPLRVQGALHTWQARIHDDAGRLCAEGEVVVCALPEGQAGIEALGLAQRAREAERGPGGGGGPEEAG